MKIVLLWPLCNRWERWGKRAAMKMTRALLTASEEPLLKPETFCRHDKTATFQFGLQNSEFLHILKKHYGVCYQLLRKSWQSWSFLSCFHNKMGMCEILDYFIRLGVSWFRMSLATRRAPTLAVWFSIALIGHILSSQDRRALQLCRRVRVVLIFYARIVLNGFTLDLWKALRIVISPTSL